MIILFMYAVTASEGNEAKLQREEELIKFLTGKTKEEVLSEYNIRDLLRLSEYLTFLTHIC